MFARDQKQIRAAAEARATTLVSHDLAVVKYMSDEVLVMREGEVVERGTPEAIFASPQHDYTKKLIPAIPRGYDGRNRGQSPN